MSQPTPYTRQYDFPNGPQTFGSFGNGLENELNAIATSISGTLTNLKLIQRDDGGIVNGLVGLDSLSTGVYTFLGSNVSAWKVSTVNGGAWLTNTPYTVGTLVVQTTNTYLCVTAHTSGTFATDLAAVKWVLLAIGTPTPPDASVTTAKIADGAVTTGKLASAAVTATNIASNAVVAAGINASAVTTAKINDGAVTLGKMASQVVGQVCGYTTAGAATAIAAGTTRQVLEATTGAVAAFTKHGGDWGRVIGSASITTTTGISFDVSGGFPLYVIYLTNVHIDTDNVSGLLTVSTDGGSTYLSANYSHHTQAMTHNSASYAAANSASTSSIPVLTAVGSATNSAFDVILYIHHAAEATNYFNVNGSFVYRDNTPYRKGGSFFGGLITTGAVTNVKFALSSGNMVSGTVYEWGEGEG